MIAIKYKNTVLIALLFCFDVALSAAGYLLAGCILNDFTVLSGSINRYILIFIILLVFFLIMYDEYNAKTDKVFNTVVSTVLSVIFASICSLFVPVLLGWEALGRPMFFLSSFIVLVFVGFWRTIGAILIKKFGEKRKCLIIESVNNTSRLARKIKYASNDGREAYYYLIDETNEEEMRILIEEKIKDYDLIFISPSIPDSVSSRIMNKAFVLEKDISILADLDSVSTLKGVIYQLDDTPVIEKKGINMSKLQAFIKRTFDIIFAVVMGILAIPAFLICAVAIKLDSKGPVIYKQERYTIHKKRFTVYKFRTMIENAEKSGAQLATEDDPRITKVGKFLRATRLDELPQLWNIFTGAMSVVGPRPERPVFADYFSKTVKDYDMRFCVKAGLTGYAQVYGKYNTRVSDKILMDIIYAINYSLLLDIKLILLTGKTMFVKSSAEGIDEEKDKILTSKENEEKRREETMKQLGVSHDNISNNSGIQL